MQINVRNSTSGAALQSDFRGDLTIGENADVTAFHLFQHDGGHCSNYHVYLPGGKFSVEIKPTGVIIHNCVFENNSGVTL